METRRRLFIDLYVSVVVSMEIPPAAHKQSLKGCGVARQHVGDKGGVPLV